MQNCQYFLMNIWFDQFCQIFVKLFEKKMKDLPKLHFPSIFIHHCAALERFPIVTFF